MLLGEALRHAFAQHLPRPCLQCAVKVTMNFRKSSIAYCYLETFMLNSCFEVNRVYVNDSKLPVETGSPL